MATANNLNVDSTISTRCNMSLYNRGSSYYSVINVPKMLVHIANSNLSD